MHFLLYVYLVATTSVSARASRGSNVVLANPTGIILRNNVTGVAVPARKSSFSLLRAWFVLMSASSSLLILSHCFSINGSSVVILVSTCVSVLPRLFDMLQPLLLAFPFFLLGGNGLGSNHFPIDRASEDPLVKCRPSK